MTRSFVAADMTLESLVAGQKFVYLWTFTFPDFADRHYAAKCWGRFRSALRNHRIDLRCVRTFELHPNGHGIHIHFVTPDFHHVNVIRPLAEKAGFGRIHAKRIPGRKAGYVLKYIRKAMNSSHEALRNAVKWRACGSDRRDWHQTCRGLHVDTQYTRAWNWLKAIHPKWQGMCWFERSALVYKVIFESIATGCAPFLTGWDFFNVDGHWQFRQCDCPF